MLCIVKGCFKAAYSKGMCRQHYDVARRKGIGALIIKLGCVALVGLLASGCYQAPPPLSVHHAPTPIPDAEILQQPPAEVQQLANQDRALEQPSQALQPGDPYANWEAYAEAYQDFKNMPGPAIQGDATPDPAVIANSLNLLTQKLNALEAQKKAIEDGLSPDDRKRWKEYQRSLETGE